MLQLQPIFLSKFLLQVLTQFDNAFDEQSVI